jgi:hypothetical protein
VLFDDVIDAFLEYQETEKRVKPSTLNNNRCLHAQPTGNPKQRGARIIRFFGGRELFGIPTADIRKFLAAMDREEISARTVNIHRQLLHAVFEYARREESFGLPDNPVAATSKRPEDGSKSIEPFEPSEILLVVDAEEKRVFIGTVRATRIPNSQPEAIGSGVWQIFRMAACTSSPSPLAYEWASRLLCAGATWICASLNAGQADLRRGPKCLRIAPRPRAPATARGEDLADYLPLHPLEPQHHRNRIEPCLARRLEAGGTLHSNSSISSSPRHDCGGLQPRPSTSPATLTSERPGSAREAARVVGGGSPHARPTGHRPRLVTVSRGAETHGGALRVVSPLPSVTLAVVTIVASLRCRSAGRPR